MSKLAFYIARFLQRWMMEWRRGKYSESVPAECVKPGKLHWYRTKDGVHAYLDKPRSDE